MELNSARVEVRVRATSKLKLVMHLLPLKKKPSVQLRQVLAVPTQVAQGS